MRDIIIRERVTKKGILVSDKEAISTPKSIPNNRLQIASQIDICDLTEVQIPPILLHNTYLLGIQLEFVKELSIYVFAQDVPTVTDILRKHKVGGVALTEIKGAGRIKRKEVRERDGWSVRTVTPEYEPRTKVETVVPDSTLKEIVDDLVSGLGSENEPRGMIFVKDVSNAYEIGTKLTGDIVVMP